MNDTHPTQNPDQPAVYRIRVQGMLDESWSNWLGGMVVSHEDQVTTISGEVSDQAVLRGMLNKLWNLNLILLSVERLEFGQSEIKNSMLGSGHTNSLKES